MRLIDLKVEQGSPIKLQNNTIEFIYRAVKSNLFEMGKQTAGLSLPKYTCDLKTLFGRAKSDPAWQIDLLTEDALYLVEVLSAFVVDADSDFFYPNSIDIKMSIKSRLIINCGKVSVYRKVKDSDIGKYNDFIVNAKDHSQAVLQIYPKSPIKLNKIENDLINYKLYYTREYTNALEQLSEIICEIDSEYLSKYFEFFQSVSQIGEHKPSLIIPVKKNPVLKNYDSVIITKENNEPLFASLADAVSFKVLEAGKDKNLWQALADKFEKRFGVAFKDQVSLCVLTFPDLSTMDKLKSLDFKLFIKEDFHKTLVSLARVITSINAYLDDKNGLGNLRLCDQVLNPDEFVLNTSYTKTYYNTLKAEYPTLSEDQLIAVDKALCMEQNNQDVMLVQGPAGTGKTELIATITKELSARGKTLLISSKLNQNVNAIADRIQYDKEVVVNKFNKIQGSEYRKAVKENKINYIKNQILAKFKVDGICIDSVEMLNKIKSEAESITEKLKKIEGYANLQKVLDKKQKILDQKDAIVQEISGYNTTLNVTKKIMNSVIDYILKTNSNLESCMITDLKKLYLDSVEEFESMFESFNLYKDIDDRVKKFISNYRQSIDKTLNQISNKIEQYITNEENIFNKESELNELLDNINAREYVLNNVNDILDNVKRNIVLGRNYGDNINPKYFEILENNSRLDSSDRVSKILKAVSIRQDVLDLESQDKLNLDEKIEILARVFVDINSYIFSTPLSAFAFEKYLSLSDRTKRWSKVFKKKKFKGVSYRDFITEIDNNIHSIINNDMDTLFDEDKEYLFMAAPLQEETAGLKSNIKVFESELQKLSDKKSKIISDASAIRMSVDESEKDVIIKEIQSDIIKICQKLDKLDASLAPIDEELDKANYKINQKALVFTRKKFAIDTVLNNIKQALFDFQDQDYLFEYIKGLETLVAEGLDDAYLDVMLGETEHIDKTEYDKIFDYKDTRGVVAMTTSQVKTYIRALSESRQENYVFDYAIIDEADLCDVSDLIVSLPSVNKLILVGDLLQLPNEYVLYKNLNDSNLGWATRIFKSDAEWDSFHTSAFYQMLKSLQEQMLERSLIDFYSVSNVAILKSQYRMNEDIFDVVKHIYSLHTGFELIDEKRFGGKDILPLQVNGEEEIENDYIHKIYNPQEVSFVRDIMQLITDNIDKFARFKTIGIVSMYEWQSKQVLAEMHKLNLEDVLGSNGIKLIVGTESDFKDVFCDLMIFSVTRTKDLDKLENITRINRILTHTIQKLVVVGNLRKVSTLMPYSSRLTTEETKQELECLYKSIIPALCKKCKMDNSEKLNLESLTKFLKEAKDE